MAVKKTNRKHTKGVNPSQPILGLYKDSTTNKFTAFDDKGGIEEVAPKQFVNNGSIETVTVDTVYGNTQTFEPGTITINDIVGQIVVDIPTESALQSGSRFIISVFNSFVQSNSIIILSKEGTELSNRSTISINEKTSGSFQITGWVGWEIDEDNDFKINFIVINPA